MATSFIPKVNVHVPKIDLASIERTLFSEAMSKAKFTVIPQGSGIVNVPFFDAIQEELRHGTCGEVQKLLQQAIQSLEAEIGGIGSEMEWLSEIIKLVQLEITDLASLFTWVFKFIEVFLGPYVKSYTTYISQIVAIAAQMMAIVQTAESALTQLGDCQFAFGGLTIPIPGLSPIVVPPIRAGIHTPTIPPRGGGTIGNLLNRGALPGIGSLTSFNPRSNGFSLQWGRPS